MKNFEILPLDSETAMELANAFAVPGWNKPREQYSRYLKQQEAGQILCLVARVHGKVAAYLKIVWLPSYQPLREGEIPEVQDLNVLDSFRRQGVATRLLDVAEQEVAKRSPEVGIGVGLHPGYNAAQRLYVLRGYVPDGRGLTHKDEPVSEGQSVTLDDDLVLHFTKQLLNS